MAGGRVLRRIGDPVVAAAPAGVRIRTRIHPTAGEAEALTAIGNLLGSANRGELAGRVRLGRLDREAHGLWRAERKQALTVVSSSRWAGAITRAVEDQYQLGMRGVVAQVGQLRAAIEVLEARCALRPGERHRSMTVEEPGVGRGGATVGMPAPGSGSSRPAGWPRCGSDSPVLSMRWRRVGRRSRWAGNGCGATVTTSMPPT